jgi:hypothetical protein
VEAGGAVSHEPKLGGLLDVELKIPWNMGTSRENRRKSMENPRNRWNI